jgi:hypothetical protein
MYASIEALASRKVDTHAFKRYFVRSGTHQKFWSANLGYPQVMEFEKSNIYIQNHYCRVRIVLKASHIGIQGCVWRDTLNEPRFFCLVRRDWDSSSRSDSYASIFECWASFGSKFIVHLYGNGFRLRSIQEVSWNRMAIDYLDNLLYFIRISDVCLHIATLPCFDRVDRMTLWKSLLPKKTLLINSRYHIVNLILFISQYL